MKHVNIIVIILMFGILISCETEIPFNGAVTEPTLAVNCITLTDTVVQANISASRFFLSNETEFKVVDNATVDLYINGVLKERMIGQGQGLYRSQYIPLEGDLVKLLVSAAGYESVWTESLVPFKVPGFQIDSTITKTNSSLIVNGGGYGGSYTQYDTIGTTYSYIHNFSIKFTDAPSESNYYRLIVKQTTTVNGYSSTNYQNNFDDIVFGTKKDNMDGVFTESPYDRYNIFTDELIDGKPHTINVYVSRSYDTFYDPQYSNDYTVTATINLQCISQSYYLYLKSLKALETANPFMSEPVQIYTNVNGGLGIMGAGANQQQIFDLSK